MNCPPPVYKYIVFKVFTILSLILFFPAIAFSQPKVPKNWDLNLPVADDGEFYVAVSDPCVSENDANSYAFRAALEYFAGSVNTNVELSVDEYSYAEGVADDNSVMESYSVTVESASFKSKVPIYGVKILDRKVEKDGKKVVVKILTYMSSEDYKKSETAFLDEETSYHIYSYFADHKSDGFIRLRGENSFTEWVRKHCVIFEFSGNSDTAKWTELLASYFSNLYMNISFYRCSFDGFPSIVIYNHPDYADLASSVLQNTGFFELKHAGAVKYLSPTAKKSVSAFSNFCSAMKDPSKIAVFGYDSFNLPSGDIFESSDSRAASKFKDLVQKNFSMQAVRTNLKFSSYDEMRVYVEGHKDDFPCRYFAFCAAETNFEEWRGKAWVNARVSFILYDCETDEEYASEDCASMPMSAVVTSLTDEQVKQKSRLAVDNACNPEKNPESLIKVMKAVFNSLP